MSTRIPRPSSDRRGVTRRRVVQSLAAGTANPFIYFRF